MIVRLTLKVLAADEAGVDVVSGEGDRAELLKVEIQDGPVDGVQIRARATQGVLCRGVRSAAPRGALYIEV